MIPNSAQQAAMINVPTEQVAKPLAELNSKQKSKITTELSRIHDLVSRVADDDLRKNGGKDKADRLI